MSLDRVVEIERAIGTLSPEELGELYAWLDGKQSPLDERIAADLASGALDEAMEEALAEERSGRVQLL